MGSSCQGNLKKNPFFGGGGRGMGWGGVYFAMDWLSILGGGEGKSGLF